MIPEEKNNKVSIIVVNWNGVRFLKNCLGALFGQTYANYEIILVDNGSSDNSVCFTRENFPEAKIVSLSENKGFTGGNAAGLETAQEPFIEGSAPAARALDILIPRDCREMKRFTRWLSGSKQQAAEERF